MRSDALFYPQTVCLDERVLKYMLLHFDRLWFLPIDNHLNPGHTSIARRFSMLDTILACIFGTPDDATYATMYSAEPTAWDDRLRRLMDTYGALEADGICFPLRDERFENPSAMHPLKPAVDADLADPEFLALCARHSHPGPIRAPERVGPGELKGGGVAFRGLGVYPLRQRDAAICSERINSALYLADAHDLVPVSTQSFFMQLFSTKLKRVVANPEFNHERNAAVQGRAIARNLLSWNIFVEVIPDHVVTHRSVNDIVQYRRESREAYAKFGDHITSLEGQIAAAPWDESFSREIERLVRGSVLPAARALQEQRTQLWESMFGKVTQRAARSITVGMSLIPALSYLELLWYAAPGAAAALGAFAPAITDAVLGHRRLRRSALFFVINLL